MKILLILVICALFVSCSGGKDTDTDAQKNDPPGIGENGGSETETEDNADESVGKTDNADKTDTSGKNTDAPADGTADDGSVRESVNAPGANTAETITAYTSVNSGEDVLYLTAVYDSGYGERGESVTEYKIEGALIFPHIPSSILPCRSYHPMIDDETDTRSFILADKNLYPVNEDILSGGATEYEIYSSDRSNLTSADEQHSLDGAELISGERDDGGKYSFYKKAHGNYTWYYGFVTVSDDKMAAIAYGDKGSEDAGWDVFLPLLKKMRTYTADGSTLEYKMNITAPHEVGGKEQWDEKYSLSFTLPDDWLFYRTIADDCERVLTGVYSIKRLEVVRGVHSPERYDRYLEELKGEFLAPATETTGETKMGYSYTHRTRVGSDDNPDCVWHIVFISVPDSDDYVMMSFVEYKEDRESTSDWFAEKCLPVIDSVVLDALRAE